MATFQLPLLNTLDQLKDPKNPKRSLLDYVICKLYSEGTSVSEIAMMLTVGETTVYSRIPQHQKRKEKLARMKPEILRLFELGECPKAIAYDLNIGIYNVYKTLKEHKSWEKKRKKNPKGK